MRGVCGGDQLVTVEDSKSDIRCGARRLRCRLLASPCEAAGSRSSIFDLARWAGRRPLSELGGHVGAAMSGPDPRQPQPLLSKSTARRNLPGSTLVPFRGGGAANIRTPTVRKSSDAPLTSILSKSKKRPTPRAKAYALGRILIFTEIEKLPEALLQQIQ